MAYVPKSKSDSWATPPHIRAQLNEQFGGPNGFSSFDPCPLGGLDDPTIPDGLSTPWPTHDGPIFVNPPYSKLASSKKKGKKKGDIGWMEKCLMESRRGTTIVVLIPLRSPDYYWQFIFQNADEYRVSKRITFGNAKSCAPFDCCVYVFRYGLEPKRPRVYGGFFPVKPSTVVAPVPPAPVAFPLPLVPPVIMDATALLDMVARSGTVRVGDVFTSTQIAGTATITKIDLVRYSHIGTNGACDRRFHFIHNVCAHHYRKGRECSEEEFLFTWETLKTAAPVPPVLTNSTSAVAPAPTTRIVPSLPTPRVGEEFVSKKYSGVYTIEKIRRDGNRDMVHYRRRYEGSDGQPWVSQGSVSLSDFLNRWRKRGQSPTAPAPLIIKHWWRKDKMIAACAQLGLPTTGTRKQLYNTWLFSVRG